MFEGYRVSNETIEKIRNSEYFKKYGVAIYIANDPAHEDAQCIIIEQKTGAPASEARNFCQECIDNEVNFNSIINDGFENHEYDYPDKRKVWPL